MTFPMQVKNGIYQTFFNCYWQDNLLLGRICHKPDNARQSWEDDLWVIGHMDANGYIHTCEPRLYR